MVTNPEVIDEVRELMKKHIRDLFFRKIFSKYIQQRIFVEKSMYSFGTVTLLGHVDLEMYLVFLKSFLVHTNVKPLVIILDDGTLTNNDINMIKKNSCRIVVISVDESYDYVVNNFVNHELILKYIRLNVLNRKLIDLFLIKEKLHVERILLVDSDVIFFNKPELIISFAKGIDNKNRYISDYQNSYICDVEVIKKIFRVQIIKKFNSGLMTLNLNILKKEDVDKYYFLFNTNRNKYNFDYEMMEQTAFAVLLSDTQIFRLPRTYYIGMKTNKFLTMICRHYVRPTRHLYINGLEKLVD